MAYTTSTKDGDAVVVPVKIKEPLFLKMAQGTATISLGLFTYLLIYPDNTGDYHTEVVTKIPQDDNISQASAQVKFSGMVRIEDWQGNFIKAYHYTNDVLDKWYTSSSVSVNSGGVKVPAIAGETCTITDTYDCSNSVTFGDTDGGTGTFSGYCDLISEDEDCSTGGGGGPTVYNYLTIYRRTGGNGGAWVHDPEYAWCETASFATDGAGNYIANINGLAAGWLNANQDVILLSFPTTCLKIPSSGITQVTANGYMASAYLTAENQVLTELNNGTTLPANASGRFISIVQSNLSFWKPGSSWDPFENCDGSAPTNTDMICAP